MGIVSLIVWSLGFGLKSGATVIEVSFKTVRTETCVFLAEGPTSSLVKKIEFSETTPDVKTEVTMRYLIGEEEMQISPETSEPLVNFIEELNTRAAALQKNAATTSGESSKLTLHYANQTTAYAHETVTWDIAALFGEKMAAQLGEEFRFELEYELGFSKGSWDELLHGAEVELVPTEMGSQQISETENRVTEAFRAVFEAFQKKQAAASHRKLSAQLETTEVAETIIHMTVERTTETEPVQRTFQGTLSSLHRSTVFGTVNKEITEVIR